MNLDKLNEGLFDLFEGLKKGTIEVDKANAMTNVANTIINNAKVQLQGLKQMQDSGIVPISLKDSTPKMIGDIYDEKLEFAKKLGHKNLAEAISKLGKENFNKLFEQHLNKL